MRGYNRRMINIDAVKNGWNYCRKQQILPVLKIDGLGCKAKLVIFVAAAEDNPSYRCFSWCWCVRGVKSMQGVGVVYELLKVLGKEQEGEVDLKLLRSWKKKQLAKITRAGINSSLKKPVRRLNVPLELFRLIFCSIQSLLLEVLLKYFLARSDSWASCGSSVEQLLLLAVKWQCARWSYGFSLCWRTMWAFIPVMRSRHDFEAAKCGAFTTRKLVPMWLCVAVLLGLWIWYLFLVQHLQLPFQIIKDESSLLEW